MQLPQRTTDWACEKTVVMAKQPGHLTSMKNELGFWTRRFSLWHCFCCSGEGLMRSTVRGCRVLVCYSEQRHNSTYHIECVST